MRIFTSLGRRLLVVALMAVMVVGGLAPAAHADHLERLCSGGNVCLFKAANYHGGIFEDPNNDDNYSGNNFQECTFNCDLNDETSSIDNDGFSCGTRHFVAAGFSGNSFWLARGAARADLAGTGFNDQLSSHRWC